MRGLLVRGMVAGLVAGLVWALFAYVFGVPSVEGAVGYEDRVAEAAAHAHGETPLVSRAVQSTLGLTVAAVVYGVAIGGIFALVHAATYGRIGRLSPRAAAAVLALVAFVVVDVVPFLKYPANPPASSVEGTVGQRTGLYLVMLLFSIAVAVGAAVLPQRLLARLGAWNAILAAIGVYVVLIGIIAVLMPAVAETPADFPATVLYEFRVASLGGHLVLWTALGLVFGALVDRSTRSTGRGAPQSVDAK